MLISIIKINYHSNLSSSLGLNLAQNKTIDAVKWLAANYPTTSYVIPAHVERAGCGLSGGAWNIAVFRDINDNGPTVAFAFEGIPGHEKETGHSTCLPPSIAFR